MRHVYHNPSRVVVDDSAGLLVALTGAGLVFVAAAAAVVWLAGHLLLVAGVATGLLAVAAGVCAGYVALARWLARRMARLTVPVGLHQVLPAPAAEQPAVAAVPERKAIEAPKPPMSTSEWLAEYAGERERI